MNSLRQLCRLGYLTITEPKSLHQLTRRFDDLSMSREVLSLGNYLRELKRKLFDANALNQHTTSMAQIIIGEQQIFFTRPNKTEDGPVLLLIHGAGGSHLGWPKEIQRLPGTHVFNVDLPGHGRSSGPACSTIDEFADVVQAFIEQLNLQQVTLVGHSMGGAIVLTLALRNLAAIRQIVVLNSSGRLRVSPQLLEFSRSEPALAANLVVQWSWGTAATEKHKQLSQANMLQTDPAVLHADFSACDRFDIRANLSHIHIPTLVICGTEDKMTPLKYGEELARNIPGAELLILEGAGHFSMLERPQEVAAAIAEFLSASKQ